MSADTANVSTMQFLTGSSFEGSWNDSVHMMDGFGTYRYPDGSEYRGRFEAGKFHGFGQLKLAQPYRLTVKGEFNQGKLVAIEDMWFQDGLHVNGEFKDDRFLCDEWDYLKPSDRRYQSELFYGQQPVGPTSYLTNNLISRTVPPKCFDAEEGIFNGESGWMMERQAPFSKTVYVSCPNEKNWIKRHCRAERKNYVEEPLPSFCRQIINNNLETEVSQLPDITLYAPNQQVQRERYYPKLCKEHEPANQPGAEQPKEQLHFKRPPFQATTTTDLCLRAALAKEQERAERAGPRPSLKRTRQWTSSSEALDGDSGATNTLSVSPSEASLHTKVKDLYDSAYMMMQKKANENLSVVQSNMKRPTSFVDISRSQFLL